MTDKKDNNSHADDTPDEHKSGQSTGEDKTPTAGPSGAAGHKTEDTGQPAAADAGSRASSSEQDTAATNQSGENAKTRGSGQKHEAKSNGTSRPANGGGSDDGRPRKGGKAAIIIAILAFLIAIIALAGSGWLWYLNQHKTTRFSQRIDTLQATLESNVQDRVMPRLADINERLGATAHTNKKQEQALSSLNSELNKIQSELQETRLQIAGKLEQLQGSTRRWQLEQVEQLLVTANRRLQLYHAPEQAKTALKLASQTISRLNDPRVVDVRKRIIDEIAALNALPSPDIEGIALTLTSFVKQVPKLPLASDVPENYKPRTESETAAQDSGADGKAQQAGINWTDGWNHFVTSLGTALQRMVTIRRTNGAQPALLPPDKVYFLRQNVMLELRSARLALLEGNSALYRTSLSTAIKWLKQYFKSDDPAVAAMIDRLHQMKSIKLEWQAPDISASLNALRDYMKARSQENQAASAKAEAASEAGQQG